MKNGWLKTTLLIRSKNTGHCAVRIERMFVIIAFGRC
jgi:hypothetical protein